MNYGGRVRAAQYLVLGAKAHAVLQGSYRAARGRACRGRAGAGAPHPREFPRGVGKSFDRRCVEPDFAGETHAEGAKEPLTGIFQQFLDPKVLASISSLDLVAKTVVEPPTVAGLHRSPTLGLSKELAEYRQYVEGDDSGASTGMSSRVRSASASKRFRGETNSQFC